METVVQAMLGIGALGGCATTICGVCWYLSLQRRRLRELVATEARQRKTLLNVRSGCRRFERRLNRQLRQTEILTVVEDVLAQRLADLEGGAARTKKSEARLVAVERIGTGVGFDSNLTSMSGVRGELQRLEMLSEDLESMLDAEEAEAAGEAPCESIPPMIAA